MESKRQESNTNVWPIFLDISEKSEKNDKRSNECLSFLFFLEISVRFRLGKKWETKLNRKKSTAKKC